MLSARAYSFRQQARLAVSLSWVGGFVNVITFLECQQLFTSHLTGAVTLLGIDAVEGKWAAVGLLLEICLAFALGAASSSALSETARRRRWPSRYVVPVALEAGLLALMCLLLVLQWGVPRLPVGLAAFAMGLQNATITQISGAVVRSTHITGVVTDLSLESVQAWFWWRDPTRRERPGRPARFWQASTWPPRLARLLLLAGILGSFVAGVVTGTLGHELLPRYVLLLPVLFLLGIVWVDWREPIGDIREIDPLGEHDLREHGLAAGAVPAGAGLYWLGRARPVGAHPASVQRHERYYHAPDFQTWFEHLPPSTTSVVLVLSPQVLLDANAALDLAHVARRLREQRRRLLLAGLSTAQRATLEEHGTLAVVGAGRVFPEVAQAVEALRREAERDALEEREGLAGL